MNRSRSLLLIFAILLLSGWLAGWLAKPALAQDGADHLIEEGARLYAENCALCHGPQGEGRVGATLSKDWPSIRPDLSIQNTIANGVSGSAMPAWSQAKGGPLSDAQIESLVAYLLTWQSGEPYVYQPEPAPTRAPITPLPEVSGDPNRGALLYDQNCKACHGPEGEGRIGATLARDWPAIRADLRVRTTIANGVSGSPMPAWSQAEGGPLNEQEIDDLTAFILSLDRLAVESAAATAAPAEGGGSGVGGALLAAALFVLLAGGILWLQRKR